MKIGILAYCSACNFGAQLQLLSTYYYLINNNHVPIVIDWMPKDLDEKYKNNATITQMRLFADERRRLWKQTRRCHDAKEIADIITEQCIEAVIIGSDAVLQHHPFWECIKFPTKKIVSRMRPSSDRLFPNPFWGTFNDYLLNPIPIAILSGSNQDSRYNLIDNRTKEQMYMYLKKAIYISVRDVWTQSMIKNISHGNIIPPVTPDPVFAFNINVASHIPTKEDILKKFNLPDNYLILSFHDSNIVSQHWIDKFQNLANTHGYTCVKLPYAEIEGFGNMQCKIPLPLSPIDWYSIIKYSNGYIGQNMHPIVVALHNKVPLFSFDNYGVKKFNGLVTDDKTSKILHILDLANLGENRVSCIARQFKSPKVEDVFDKILRFDKTKAEFFANEYYQLYLSNMENILNALIKSK